jgi:Tfp pilus assembly protein PilF
MTTIAEWQEKLLGFADEIVEQEQMENPDFTRDSLDGVYNLERLDYWDPKVQEKNGILDYPTEPINFALARPKYYDEVSELTGIPIPWALTPEQQEKHNVKYITERVDKHIAKIKKSLAPLRPKENSDDLNAWAVYEKLFATALASFCLSGKEMAFEDSLRQRPLWPYKEHLRISHGLALQDIHEDLPSEGTVYDVLMEQKAMCTEKSYVFRWVADRAGLKTRFASVSTTDGASDHMLNLVLLRNGETFNVDMNMKRLGSDDYAYFCPIDDSEALTTYINNGPAILNDPANTYTLSTLSVALDPADPRAHLRLATYYDISGQPEKAMEEFQAAMDRESNAGKGSFNGTLAFIDNHPELETSWNKKELARTIYDRLRPFWPNGSWNAEDKIDNGVTLANAASILGYDEEVLKIFKIIEASPVKKPIEYWHAYPSALRKLGMNDKAMAFYELGCTSTDPKIAHYVKQRYFNWAIHLYNAGDPYAADIALKAYRFRPNDPEVVSETILILSSFEGNEEALAQLTQSSANSNDLVNIAYGKAARAYKQEKYEEALKIALDALEKFPNNEDLKNVVMVCGYNVIFDAVKAGNLSKAIQYVQTLMKDHSKLVLTDEALYEASLHTLMTAESWLLAEQFIEEKEKIDPNNPDILGLKAQIQAGLGNTKEAEILFRQAVASNPQDADLHFNFAIFWQDQGNNEQTNIYAAKACKIDPRFSPSCKSYR